METNLKINEKVEFIFKHVYQFFPSLKEFPEKYIPRIFVNIENPPEHLVYLCPLCLNNFILIEEQLGLVWSQEFSPDHFPPESVGGQFKILVCKPCNSNAGAMYDYVLKDLMDRMSFDNKVVDSKIRAKSTVSNVPGRYSSEFYINKAGEYEISFKPNEKAHAPFIDKWLEESKSNSDWQANITINNPNEKKIAKALVKAAYLFCFGNWGYDFVFSENAEMIRNYLNDEGEYPVKVPFGWVGEKLREGEIPHFPQGLCYLQEPKSCKSFVVNIQLINKDTEFLDVAIILIPNPSEKGWEELKTTEDRLKIHVENGGKISVAHVLDFIVSKQEYNGYTKSWMKLTEL